MKNLEDNTVTTTAKQAYVKPAMEVYEMEVETSILTDTQSGLDGSEARVNDLANPFGETFTDLKA